MSTVVPPGSTADPARRAVRPGPDALHEEAHTFAAPGGTHRPGPAR